MEIWLLVIFSCCVLLKGSYLCTGAAAVANIAAPRSAVATPIVRSTTNLQSTAGTQHTTR
jgi:hypothetical protein